MTLILVHPFGMQEIVISSMYYSLKWNLSCFFCLSNLCFSIPPQHSQNHPSPFFRAPCFPFRLIKVSPDLKADKGISAFTLALLYGECLAALVRGPWRIAVEWSTVTSLDRNGESWFGEGKSHQNKLHSDRWRIIIHTVVCTDTNTPI